MFYGFGNLMFTIVPVIITIGFIAVFGMVVMTFVSAARQKRKDDNSPVLTVAASIVTKRADVRHTSSHSGTGMNHIHTYRHYYATFQVESGDRMELEVQENMYGLLAEGDYGRLTFQGKRFLNFDRDRR